MASDKYEWLNNRLGTVHARQRLGIEEESPRVFGKGINFFHPENWYSMHAIQRYLLKITGIYWYGRRKTLDIRLRQNDIALAHLPAAFDGLTLLHLSDLHVDMYPEATQALLEVVEKLDYDLCVITGDYRAWTSGSIDEAMAGMQIGRAHV